MIFNDVSFYFFSFLNISYSVMADLDRTIVTVVHIRDPDLDLVHESVHTAVRNRTHPDQKVKVLCENTRVRELHN